MKMNKSVQYKEYIDSATSSNHLKTEYVANEEEAFTNEDVRRDIAAKLFQVPVESIITIERDSYFKYFNNIRSIQKVNTTLIGGIKKSFYLKQSWEGKYLEGCGMALHNIFYDEGFNFIMSENKNSGIISVEDIGDTTLWEVEAKDLNNTTIRNYGSALEFAAMIGLDDRDSRSNFIITPTQHVINIDFGKIFQKKYTHPIQPCISIPKGLRQQLEYGRKEGRKILRERLESRREDIEEIIYRTAELKGFENTKYASKINQEYISETYNTFMNNLERMK
jgi:hypothetical protein